MCWIRGAKAFGIVADFNQDGKQDLAVSNLSGSVSVFLGNRDGTFSAAQNTSLNAMGLAAAYVVRVSNGVQTIEPVYATQGGFIVPAPVDLGSPLDQSYLVLFGTGIRGATATVSYDNNPHQQVSYSGAQPGTPGLDQVNVLLPRGLGTPVTITVTAGGIISNAVSIQVP